MAVGGEGTSYLSQHPDPVFIPGLELSSAFYTEIVAPIIADAYPRLRYAAALIGYGSEVLGYDTARSTDHEWGPRMLLFVSDDDHAQHAEAIEALLGYRLPPTFRGFSTHFGPPGADGVQKPATSTSGPITHKIPVYPLRGLLTHWLGVDPLGALTAVDWLLMPQQKLLEITAGRVFHDGLGELEPVRARLAYYPPGVWRYLLAAQWTRISQQEAFVGRAGEVGDDVGSAVIAAALVRDLMGLCFLLERRYAPYSKWFGTAFAELALRAAADAAFPGSSFEPRRGRSAMRRWLRPTSLSLACTTRWRSPSPSTRRSGSTMAAGHSRSSTASASPKRSWRRSRTRRCVPSCSVPD